MTKKKFIVNVTTATGTIKTYRISEDDLADFKWAMNIKIGDYLRNHRPKVTVSVPVTEYEAYANGVRTLGGILSLGDRLTAKVWREVNKEFTDLADKIGEKIGENIDWREPVFFVCRKNFGKQLVVYSRKTGELYEVYDEWWEVNPIPLNSNLVRYWSSNLTLYRAQNVLNGEESTDWWEALVSVGDKDRIVYDGHRIRLEKTYIQYGATEDEVLCVPHDSNTAIVDRVDDAIYESPYFDGYHERINVVPGFLAKKDPRVHQRENLNPNEGYYFVWSPDHTKLYPHKKRGVKN